MDHYRARYAILTARSLDHLAAEVQAAGETPGEAEIRRRAMHVLWEALSQPGVWPPVRQVLVALAPKMEQAGHREEWIPLLEAALARSRREADRATEAFLLYHLGILYRLQSRYVEAEEAFTSSAAGYSALGDAAGRARTISRYAYLAWTRRDFAQARRLAEEILDQGDELEEAADAQAYARLVLGAVAFEEGDWQPAHDHFQAAQLLWTQHGNLRMAGTALFDRALALQEMERYEEAVSLYNQALDLLDAVGDVNGWAVAQMNLGILHRRRGAHGDALAAYRAAEGVFRRTHNRLLLARLYNNIGQVYRDQERWQEAERAYRLSIEVWQELGNVAEEVNTLDNLIACLSAQGRQDEAGETLHKAQTLLETVVHDPSYPHLLASLQEKRADL